LQQILNGKGLNDWCRQTFDFTLDSHRLRHPDNRLHL
jgi:hypothetical protein